MGRLIPAGTGFDWYKNVQIPPDEPPPPGTPIRLPDWGPRPPPPTEEELELEREMEYFVEPEEGVLPRGVEPAE